MYIAFGTTEIQGHCQVCHTKCRTLQEQLTTQSLIHLLVLFQDFGGLGPPCLTPFMTPLVCLKMAKIVVVTRPEIRETYWMATRKVRTDPKTTPLSRGFRQ